MLYKYVNCRARIVCCFRSAETLGRAVEKPRPRRPFCVISFRSAYYWRSSMVEANGRYWLKRSVWIRLHVLISQVEETKIAWYKRFLREKLVDWSVPFLVLLEDLSRDNHFQNQLRVNNYKKSYLSYSELEIFLCDMLSSFSQGIHSYHVLTHDHEKSKQEPNSPASVQIPRTSAPEHWPIFSASTRRLMPRWRDICIEMLVRFGNGKYRCDIWRQKS